MVYLTRYFPTSSAPTAATVLPTGPAHHLRNARQTRRRQTAIVPPLRMAFGDDASQDDMRIPKEPCKRNLNDNPRGGRFCWLTLAPFELLLCNIDLG